MRILYAEDERDLNDLVTRRLVAEGYGVDSCLDGQQAWDYLQAADYDAAILDIMMPHLDGLSVLKKLRAAGKTTPVLLLTARDAIADRVAGLDSGANDYLVKPFALEELSARLRVLTRSQFGAGDSRLVAGDLTLDTGTRRVKRGGAEIALSAREYACTTRASCFPAKRSKITSGISITRAARTSWTCTSAICAKRSTTAMSAS